MFWGGFVAVVLLGIGVVAVAAPWPSNDVASLFTAIIGVLAVIDFGSVFWIRSVGAAAILTADSNDDIRRAYARRMLLACAFSITPAFLAFVFVLVAGTTKAFYAVSVLALVVLVISAPRRADIDRLDGLMIDEGRPFRVSAALDS